MWWWGERVRGGERGGHAGGDAEGERDERVGVHRDGAKGRECRAVEVGPAVRVGARVRRVHEGGHDRDRLRGVAEERAELIADGAGVGGEAAEGRTGAGQPL